MIKYESRPQRCHCLGLWLCALPRSVGHAAVSQGYGHEIGLDSTVLRFPCTLETPRKARRLQALGSLLEASISTGVCDGCVTSYAQGVRPHLYLNDDIGIKECTARSGRHVRACQASSPALLSSHTVRLLILNSCYLRFVILHCVFFW